MVGVVAIYTHTSTPLDKMHGKTPFYLLHGYDKKDSFQNKLGRPSPPEKSSRENEIDEVKEIRDKMNL